MIAFDRILQKLFNGFAIDADTVLLQDLEKSGETRVFLVKKSQHYITLHSLHIILSILFASTLNIVLFFYTPVLPNEIQAVLGLLLGLNILIWYISIIRYLFIYNSIYGVFKIMNAASWIPILQKGDVFFRSFFNQTIILISFYILIIVVFILAVIQRIDFLSMQDSAIIGINTCLFVWQFYQVLILLGRFVNLEMDFVIVTREYIKHFNQNLLGVQTTTIATNTIKSISSNTSGFFRALFDYGQVDIAAQGSDVANADISLTYIKSPEKVEGLLQLLKKEGDEKLSNIS